MNKSKIELKEISFEYAKNKKVFNNLNLKIDSYGIYGVLGHNGAGKTTLFKMLLELITPSSGDIYFEKDLYYKRNKLSISYMPENNGIYENLTVMQNIKFRGRANGLSNQEIKIESEVLLEKFDLFHKKDEKVANLSNGMKKKLH